MTSIQTRTLPNHALLKRYQESGAYADCYFAEISGQVSQAQFVEAFYTTALFKLERFILRWLVARPSSDEAAHKLAEGSIDNFAAWSVEDRTSNQLLLADFRGRTRSWLMTVVDTANNSTCLYFGSAVVPIVNRETGESKMGPVFTGLLGFHRLYSRALLRLAIARLQQNKLSPYIRVL